MNLLNKGNLLFFEEEHYCHVSLKHMVGFFSLKIRLLLEKKKFWEAAEIPLRWARQGSEVYSESVDEPLSFYSIQLLSKNPHYSQSLGLGELPHTTRLHSVTPSFHSLILTGLLWIP